MEDESALAPKRVAVPGRVLWVVLAIWMVALGFRVAYITQINPDQPLTGDGGYYHALGNSLPKEGFRRAFEFSMVTEETAAHPPGYPVLLSLGSRIGLTTPDDHRMLTALVGSLAVPLLALSAARLAGRRRRGADGARRAGHRHRRQRAPAGGLLRDVRAQAVLRARVALRADRLRVVTRPDWPVHQRHDRLRAGDECYLRARSAGFDLGAHRCA